MHDMMVRGLSIGAEENKDFKKGGGGKLGQGMGALKERGTGTPLRTIPTVFQVFKVLKNLLDSLRLRFRHKF